MRRAVWAAVLLAAACQSPAKGLLRERPPAPSASIDPTGVTFYYEDISASNVYVAGQFNDWANKPGDRKLLAMAQDAQGMWTATIPYQEHTTNPKYDRLDDQVYVEHGKRYAYKLVVNGSNWITDPSNPSQVNDGAGNINSLLVAP